MTDSAPSPASRTRRLAVLVAGAFAVGAVAGLGAVYGIGALTRNPAGPVLGQACPARAHDPQRIAPLLKGEVAALNQPAQPILIPPVTFSGPDGAPRTLADWRGRTVLLNLWATWCVPCRKEMPALDALQGRFGGPDFEVVAVNIDTRDADKPRTWLKETGITRLAYYADPEARIFQDLKRVGRAFGMPTSILIDRNGCEIATLAGPAEWTSEDAYAVVAAALGR